MNKPGYLDRPQALTMSIVDLLRDLRSGKIALPAFQRLFVWSSEDVVHLFDSICRGYPIGALILWETDQIPAARSVLGRPLADPPARYVLDGQQRLTSLGRVLLRSTLRPLDAGDYRWRVFYDLKEGAFRTQRPCDVPQAHFLPLSEVADTLRYLKWLQGLPDSAEREMLIEQADWVARAIRDYQMPAYLIRGDEDQARTIFSRLNSAGRPLDEELVFLVVRGDDDIQARRSPIVPDLAEALIKNASIGRGELQAERSTLEQGLLAMLNAALSAWQIREEEQAFYHGVLAPWLMNSLMISEILEMLMDKQRAWNEAAAQRAFRESGLTLEYLKRKSLADLLASMKQALIGPLRGLSERLRQARDMAHQTQMIREALDVGSAYEEHLHRDLIHAASVLRTAASAEPAIIKEIVDRLAALRASPIPVLRRTALLRLIAIAAQGKSGALVAIRDSLEDERLVLPCLQALREFGLDERIADLCGPLRDLAASAPVPVREAAIGALGPVLDRDDASLSVVCDALDDPHRDVRTAAAGALGPLAQTYTSVRRRIEARLTSPDAAIRANALRAFNHVALVDASVRDRLLNAADSPDPECRAAAASSMLAILFLKKDDEAEKKLIELAQDPHPLVHSAALSGLSFLSGRKHELVKPIMDVIEKIADAWPLSAALALHGLAPGSDVSAWLLSRLEGLLSHQHAMVRAAATTALGKLVSRADVAEALLPLLEDASLEVADAALTTLAPQIANRADLRTWISERMSSARWDVLTENIDTFDPVVPGHAGIAGWVMSCADSSRDKVRMAALRALGPILAKDDAGRARLLAAITDPHAKIRALAIEIAQPLAATHESIRAAMVARLQDESINVRHAALKALAPLASNEDDVRAALERMLDDRDLTIAAGACFLMLRHLPPSERTAYSARMARLVLRVPKESIVPDAPLTSIVVGPLLDNEPLRQQVQLELSRIDPDAAKSLTDVLAKTVPLIGDRSRLQQALLQALTEPENPDDFWRLVMQASVSANLSAAGDNAELENRFRSLLVDPNEKIRAAGALAIAPRARISMDDRALLLRMLDDPSEVVRQAAVQALTPLVGEDRLIREQIFPFLGLLAETAGDDLSSAHGATLRRGLAFAFGPILADNPELYAKTRAMLQATAWQARQGAAWALFAMPGGPPKETWEILDALSDDLRGEESLLLRLKCADLILANAPSQTEKEEIQSLLREALSFASHPHYCISQEGAKVRALALRLLGKHGFLTANQPLCAQVIHRLHKDPDAGVRDAAYEALSRPL